MGVRDNVTVDSKMVIDFEFEFITVDHPSYFKGVATRSDMSDRFVGMHSKHKRGAADDAIERCVMAKNVPKDVLKAMERKLCEFEGHSVVPDPPEDVADPELPKVYVALHVEYR